MPSPFDKIAHNYDDLFTNSAIGKLQRNIICKYLDNSLAINQKGNVLELNCGTGEDAIYFARKGLSVVATDVSEKMLNITEEKINRFRLNNYIKIKKLDLTNFSEIKFEKKFDLVFSNFGGLNCLDKESLQNLSIVLTSLLNDRGRIIFVIMPKYSFWESFYFLFKLKPNEVFRRASSQSLYVNINGENVQTFYYSPKNIKNIFGSKFKVMNIKPVGVFIPPSYLNNYFLSKNKTLRMLNTLESSVSNISSLASYSDHFLIDMEIKR